MLSYRSQTHCVPMHLRCSGGKSRLENALYGRSSRTSGGSGTDGLRLVLADGSRPRGTPSTISGRS